MAVAETRDRRGGRRTHHRVIIRPLYTGKDSLAKGRDLYPLAEWAALRVSMGPCRLELREHGWCPHVGCSHHLYLDVSRAGTITLNFPHLEPWEMEESCALEVAERDGATLEEIGRAMNLTRERVRQLERRALGRLRRAAWVDDGLELVREMDALRSRREGDVGLPRTFQGGFREMQPSDWPSMAGGRAGPPGGRRHGM